MRIHKAEKSSARARQRGSKRPAKVTPPSPEEPAGRALTLRKTKPAYRRSRAGEAGWEMHH